MKSYAFTINLKDDSEIIKKYDEYHRNVPEAVIKYARRRGILRSKIFRLGHHLFMFIETSDDFDPSAGLIPRTNDDSVVREFEGEIRTLQEKVQGAGPDEWWAQMKLVHEFE